LKTELAAAVLCGGRGERLRLLTDYFQKTMISLGQKQVQLLEQESYRQSTGRETLLGSQTAHAFFNASRGVHTDT
jgi:hypothetical protein